MKDELTFLPCNGRGENAGRDQKAVMDNAISIELNGEPRRIEGTKTLLSLLQGLNLDPRAVVVELNRTIIRRPELDRTALREGDRVELVHFVGGG